jgi:peptidoglycan/LPS O-acetylase OafA/YrhL
MANPRNAALDGIRGIAIISVVLFHATLTIWHFWAPLQALLVVTHAGWLGVEVFFALSGFLITGILLRSKADAPGAFFGRFYWRRALRIFPLYFGVIATLSLLAVSFSSDALAKYQGMQGWFWLQAANLARAYYGATPSLEFGVFELTHFWTLAVEEHFYLVWPLLVYFLPVRWLVGVALFCIGVSLTFRASIVVPHSALGAVLMATPTYLAGLAIGSLCAVFLHFGKTASVVTVPTFGAIVCCLAVAFGITAFAGQSSEFPANAFVAFFAALGTGCVAMLVSTAPAGRLASLLNNRILVIYGKYSYGIYVFHYLLGPLTRRAELAKWPVGYTLAAIFYVALYLLVPLGVAIFSYRCWEQRWLRLKDRVSTPTPLPVPLGLQVAPSSD